MRHRKKFNHLGRKAAHRKAMLSNMASSLLLSDKKRVITTLAKAKALRTYVEPLITKGKNNTTHSRRVVFSYLQNKYAVNELFTEVAPAVADRPGGYTRVLKLGPRQGDNAEMALIELVDFNEYALEAPKKKTRRRKKKSTSTKNTASEASADAKETVEEETLVEEIQDSTEVAAEDNITEIQTTEEKVESTEETASEEDTETEK